MLHFLSLSWLSVLHCLPSDSTTAFYQNRIAYKFISPTFPRSCQPLVSAAQQDIHNVIIKPRDYYIIHPGGRRLMKLKMVPAGSTGLMLYALDMTHYDRIENRYM